MHLVARRRFDPSRNLARFYAVSVQPTLFGSWVVVRRWGRIDTDGRRAETWFDDLSSALSCAEVYAQTKVRRGYKRVQEAPRRQADEALAISAW